MKELLFSITKKDFKIHWFSGTGAGGQSRNKNQLCVRLQHPESGTQTTGQSHKSRQANLREAFTSLIKHPTFKAWHSRKVWGLMSEKTIDELVMESMHEDNLKVEGKDDGKWKELHNIMGMDE